MGLVKLADGREIEINDGERQRCETWSRVMGYYRPVQEWNVGKKQEHRDRTHFIEPKEFDAKV